MSDPLGDWLDRLVPLGEASASESDDSLPAALGLQLVEVVSTGATATVLRARDPLLERDVAVKLSRAGDDDGRDALLEEARATARLRHPSVLPVHRVTELGGRVYLELQWGSGQSLADASDVLRHDPPPLGVRLAVVRALASVLAHAHAQGLCHGDVHPGNVLVDEPATGGAVWLCDWGASLRVVGHPGYAAPERLRGGPPTPESDIGSLGILAWELCAARELRTRRHEESVGAWISRVLRQSVPAIPGLPPALGELLAGMTSDSAARPTAAAVVESLDAFERAEIVRGWADGVATASLERAQAALVRERELTRRRFEEERVVAVLRAKVPPYAPTLDKRPIREAEDRVRELTGEVLDSFRDALDAVSAARLLASDPAPADALSAELWWERLTVAEGGGDLLGAAQARRRIDASGGPAARRVAERMRAPGTLTLTTDAPGATVQIARVVERGTLLVPEVVGTLPIPLHGHALAPGPWLLRLSAPGRAPAVLPLLLGRLEQHRAEVRLYTPAEVGEGWLGVPGGPFRMGGDPGARNPIAACSPFVGDRFMLRTCVTSAEYLAFLDALPVEEAGGRCPGEVGLFGQRSQYWRHTPTGWTLPEGWEPTWPVMGVSLDDAVAYAAWRSVREGRLVRVPTEEEWEKASRGADGRLWPWGNRFDPTHCHMRESRPGVPRPAPVASYPADTSVYGVMDTAGGMREWTTSTYQEGQVVMRGGTWGDDADDCRCASRAGLQPGFRMPWVSFRLVSEEPRRP